MQASVRTVYGDPSVVHLADVPCPAPGDGEVLVDVQCAGVDRGVLHLVEGTPYALRLVFGLRPKRPVLGLDLAGTVSALGEGVTGFRVGDEVLGIGPGSFGQFCAAPQGKLVHKPKSLTWEQAAALPVSGLTALQAVEAARVQSGQRVLVLGASGGVGTLAVQIAVAKGAEVIAVCSAAKADRVRALGAARVLDYAHDDLPTGMDAVLAIGGNASIRQLRRLLVPKGVLIVVGGEGGGQVLGIGRQIRATMLNPFVSQRLAMLVSRESGEDLQRLVDLGITPVVGATYPLHQAGQALADMAAGRLFGKAVLKVAGQTPQ